MPLIAFKDRFASKVERGRKRQTIRRGRDKAPTVGSAGVIGAGKRGFGFPPAAPTETLILASGVRTKKYRELRRARCSSVERIEIHLSKLYRGRDNPPTYYLMLNFPDSGDAVTRVMCDDHFARADGFRDADDMRRFWMETHDLTTARPFKGWLVTW